ncbi:hypothetical protein FPG3_07205 [Flavobacterium psychrophilum FPG3]|nr:hypothetical protein FPG3_07205 [Flavobacterium psychrophilum FPG3]
MLSDLRQQFNGIFILNSSYLAGSVSLDANVPALGEVANFGTNYFLLKIKFLAKCKREFTTKFAILPNAC